MFLYMDQYQDSKPGVGNLRSVGRMWLASNSYAAPPGPQRRKNNTDKYYVYLNESCGAARHKNHNSFSARDGKEVAHHCSKHFELIWHELSWIIQKYSSPNECVKYFTYACRNWVGYEGPFILHCNRVALLHCTLLHNNCCHCIAVPYES